MWVSYVIRRDIRFAREVWYAWSWVFFFFVMVLFLFLCLFCASSVDVGCVVRFLLLLLSCPLDIVLLLAGCYCIFKIVAAVAVVDVEFMNKSFVCRCVLCCLCTPRYCFDFGFAVLLDLGWLYLRDGCCSGPSVTVSFVVLVLNLFWLFRNCCWLMCRSSALHSWSYFWSFLHAAELTMSMLYRWTAALSVSSENLSWHQYSAP